MPDGTTEPTLQETRAETYAKVREATGDKYKYGFVTDIEQDRAPKGLNEDVIRFISAKKADEPEWLLEWRLKAYRHWLDMPEPDLGAWSSSRRSTTRTPTTTPRPSRRTTGPKSLDEVDPELLRTYEKLGHPAAGTGVLILAGVAVDAVFDSVSVATTFKAKLEKPASSSARSPRRCKKDHPELVQKYLGTVVPAGDNKLRLPEFRRVHRRLLRLRAQGRALPDGALDLFPHQRREHRPVRAHADHRRRGLLRQLPGRLHRAHARREPAARRRGRADRPGRRRDQVLDRAELVPRRRRTARAASTTSSPSAAPAAAATPRSPGPRWRPVRRSPGSTRAASCRATTRSASSTRSP